MVNDQDYRRAGVPTSLLGCSYNNWRKMEILAVLDHYGRGSRRLLASKLELMGLLHELVRELSLTRGDKWRIVRAYWTLPPLQSQVLTALNATMNSSRPSENTSRDDESEEEKSILEHHEPTKPTCKVCFETLDPNNMPSRNITAACQHNSGVCKHCVMASIITQFNHKGWNQVECPSCSQRPEYHDMETFADRETFET